MTGQQFLLGPNQWPRMTLSGYALYGIAWIATVGWFTYIAVSALKLLAVFFFGLGR